MLRNEYFIKEIEHNEDLLEIEYFKTWKEDTRVEECHGFHTFIDEYDETIEILSVKKNNIEINFNEDEILKLI